MIVYDLFCGAGGASEGMRQLGLDPIGFDGWPLACESHQANGHRTVCALLDDYPWRGTCDVLWASPPCQPFSAAGKGDGEFDDRDGMPAFIHAVAELRPPLVVMENVKGLTFDKHRRYLSNCTQSLMRLGYDLEWRVLCAADYGVPQTRERLIIIARRDGGPIRWPHKTHGPNGVGVERWVTMGDALGWDGRVGFPRKDDKGDSPDGYRERDWFSTDRPAPMVTGKARSWVLSTGRRWDAAAEGGRGGPGAQRVPIDEPSPTISAQTISWVFERPATTIAGDSRVWPPGHKINADDVAHGRSGHDRAGTNAIRVTVDEAAVLQGFPAGYVFNGSRSAQFQQVGNAVPPALARAVLSRLL